jgi:hypothetical protein
MKKRSVAKQNVFSLVHKRNKRTFAPQHREVEQR